MLRWWRESVRHKPYRFLIEFVRSFFYILVGNVGKVFALFLLRRRNYSQIVWKDLRHIVILRPDRIGDMVLALPTVAAVQKACPQAKITLVCSEKTLPIVKELKGIDVVAIPGDSYRELKQSKSILLSVKAGKPDLILTLEAKWAMALLTWWLEAPQSIGYDIHGMGWVFSHAVSYPYYRVKQHQIEVNLNLVRANGLESLKAPNRVTLPINENAKNEIKLWLEDHNILDDYVLVHPGSRSAFTRWHPERYALVMDEIHRRWAKPIVILCGPGEEALIENVLSKTQSPIIVAKALTLNQTVALIAQALVFIGNATGTMHMASAVCRHVVAIIGGTHPHDCPERWGAWGEGHIVVHKRPEEMIGRKTNHWLGPEGLEFIQPEDVVEAVSVFLDESEGSS